MKFHHVILAPLTLLAVAAAPASQPVDASAAQRVRADVEFLASDLLEGRDTGSKGYEIGASYVASQFRAIGLQPGGTGGSWYEQVPFRRSVHVAPPTASLVTGKDQIQLQPGADIAVRPSLLEQTRTIDAPLVFVGHGISDKQLGIDDYAGLDVRGKIVVALEGTPAGLGTEESAHLNSYKANIAASKGAVGLVEVAGTGTRPNFNLLSYYDRPVVDWVDSTGKTQSQSTRIGLSAAMAKGVAAKLFANAGKDFAKIVAAAGKPGTLRGFDLPARLRVSDSMEWKNFTSPEVIGLLPGSDPKLKDEYVVLMGHLDHLGVKTNAKPGEDAIYNGALDNGAGVATILEAAHAFTTAAQAPRRSILFMLHTGEEKGLLGSRWFVSHPTVPLSRIAGNINLDQLRPIFPLKLLTVHGLDDSSIGDDARSVANGLGIAVQNDPEPERNLLRRTDHWPFMQAGVPAVNFVFGYKPGTKSEQIYRQWYRTGYHKPQDDLKQPMDFKAAGDFNRFFYALVETVADAPQAPAWKPTSPLKPRQ